MSRSLKPPAEGTIKLRDLPHCAQYSCRMDSREDLLHMGAGPSLYSFNETKLGDLFDIFKNRQYRNVPQRLFACILESGQDEPRGVEEVVVRPDGSRIIFQWMLDPYWEIPISVLEDICRS